MLVEVAAFSPKVLVTRLGTSLVVLNHCGLLSHAPHPGLKLGVGVHGSGREDLDVVADGEERVVAVDGSIASVEVVRAKQVLSALQLAGKRLKVGGLHRRPILSRAVVVHQEGVDANQIRTQIGDTVCLESLNGIGGVEVPKLGGISHNCS